MQALLLAAGLGTRLYPLTHYFPKCLTPIQGRPLLGIWLESLVDSGFTNIFINLHYMPELVRSYVEQTPYADYVQWIYEPTLLGTAGTLIHCRGQLRDEPLLLVHADNVSQCSLPAMWCCHVNRSAAIDMTMMTFTTDHPHSCGIVETDSTGVITAFHEKVEHPPGNCANAAVYILSHQLINKLDPDVHDFSTQVVAAKLTRTQTWHNACCHRDIGSLASLLRAADELVEPLSSPVTAVWRDYWQSNRWVRLKSLAQELAHHLSLPLLSADQQPLHPLASVWLIEQFSEQQWSCLAPVIDTENSIVLIGEGCAETIKQQIGNAVNYLLFVASPTANM